MDFELSSDQLALRDAVARVCERFPDEYWLERDQAGGFPHDFHAALAQDGWLGIAMPPEFGGAGLGMTEAALMMQTIAASGAGFAGASAVHMNIFGLNPVVVFGNPAQRQHWLPPLIAGRQKACFAVTEPDAGLDTTHLQTRAERQGDHYVVHGRKIWISTAQVADKMLLLARTTPLAEAAKPTQGLTLFYTDLDRERVEVREIEKMGRKAVDSNMLFIDGLRIPVEDRIGDLKQAAGRQACLKLAEGCDALLYNIRPQAMARLGLDYETVAARNPRLVYVGAYGYSEAGPYAGRPAYDDLIQGQTGIAELAARQSGELPRYAPLTLADRSVGLHVAIALLSGVLRARADGQGQAIEVPMFEGMAHMVLGDHLGGHSFEPPLGPTGYARLLAPHRRPYATADGYICLLIYNDKHWRNFFDPDKPTWLVRERDVPAYHPANHTGTTNRRLISPSRYCCLPLILACSTKALVMPAWCSLPRRSWASACVV
jgi:hypothetical protein